MRTDRQNGDKFTLQRLGCVLPLGSHDFELVIYVEQSDAVTFGVGSEHALISTFSNCGSLHNVPVAGSLEEGLSKLVGASGITTSF